jgi:hypothetical protein
MSPAKNLPNATKPALITNETSRRKPTARTIPNEKNRCLIAVQTPPFV